MLTFEQIKELIELVAQNHLQTLEIERSGFKLTIGGREAPVPAVVTAAVPAPSPASAHVDAPVNDLEPPPVTGVDPPEIDAHILASPIVGTFYGSPSPDAEAFVRVGDFVEKGQVLCIVEAMKLMNEIEADVAGQVSKVFPKNEQPVEYGEPLFAIQER